MSTGASPQARPKTRWVVERRQSEHPLWVMSVSAMAFFLALVVTAFIFRAYGHSPLEAYQTIFQRTFTSFKDFSEVLRKSTPLLLCGVGLILAFRAKFWNIGAEGQILAGALAAGGVALFVPIPPSIIIPVMFLAGFIAGGLWGFIPAILKVRLGVNEIITTLMMNYVAFFIVQWLINGPWKGKQVYGFPYSDNFERYAWLPTIYGKDIHNFLVNRFGIDPESVQWVLNISKTRLHWPTLLLAIVLTFVVVWILNSSKIGFEIRMMGESPEAARYSGVNFFRTTIVLMLISGGAAGIAGVGEVAGIHHKIVGPDNISLGYGYTAIIVALLARGRPLAALITAPMLGLVFAAGDVMKVSLKMPFQITDVISGLVLFFLICSEPLLRYRLRRVAIREEG